MARHDPEREARLKEAAATLQRTSNELETIAFDLAPIVDADVGAGLINAAAQLNRQAKTVDAAARS